VAYVPYVPSSDLQEFDSQIIEEGFDDFYTWEFNDSKDHIPVLPREAYFPINYLIPFNPNRSIAFGLDIGSQESIRAALDNAGNLGEVVILPDPPIHISSSETDYAFWIISPLYKTSTPETLEERQRQLQGFIIASVDVQTLIENATTRFADGGVVLQIQDITADQPSILFENSRINFGASSGLITKS
jgi:CHASE1-domain containing sensor protein